MIAARITLAFCVFLAVFMSFVPFVSAGAFVPLSNVEGSRLETIFQTSDQLTLSGFLTGLFTAVISVAAILAVLRLGYAGYLYMTSESWGSKGKAKEVMGDVVLGLLLLLSCWLILNQINPDILKLDILNSLSQAKTTSPASPAPAAPAAAPQVQIPPPSVATEVGQRYNTWPDPVLARLVVFRNRVDLTCTYYDPATQAPPPRTPQYAAIANGQCPPEGAAIGGPI